jgi:hypothetical protein
MCQFFVTCLTKIRSLLLPRDCHHIFAAKSKSKVASTITQSIKQRNNKWGVEAMLFGILAQHKLPV